MHNIKDLLLRSVSAPRHTSYRQITAPLICGALFCLAVPSTVLAQWIDFNEVSASRIVTDELDPDPVGLTDTFEKDLEVGDVDRDGDLDVIIVRKVRFSTPGGKRNVLYMNEGGVFVDRSADLVPDFADLTDDRDVVLVDVDGDEWVDLVTATTFSDPPRVYMNLGEDSQGVWQGFDYEVLDNRIPPFTPGPKFCAVAAGDIDNDLDQDLIFVDYSNDLEDRLLINDGNGFFSDETESRFDSADMWESAFGTDAQIVDMNGDGAADIIKISTLGGNPSSVRVIYNAGGVDIGTFDHLQHASTGSPYMMEVGDLNNDNRPDIYVVNDGQDAYVLNMGNDAQGHVMWNSIDVDNSPASNGFGGNVKLVDLDNNGFRDVLLADVDTDFQICDRQPVALRNDGTTPTPDIYDPLNGVQPSWMPEGVFDMVGADFNGDGRLDIWAGTCNGNRLYFAHHPFFDDSFESADTSAWSSSFP